MFGFKFVSSLLVEEGKIRVNQLLVRLQFFCLVPFLDRAGIIGLAVIGHAKPKLSIEMFRILSQDSLKLGNGAVELPRAEVEHRVVILVLQ